MTTDQGKAARRSLPTSDVPEVRLVVCGGVRAPGRLDQALDEAPEDPALDAVVAVARAHTGAESWMLTGGEPTLRRDLPRLVRALADAGAPRLGLVTDGLALGTPKVAGMLAELGLTRVRVQLHSARADAHDWLVGQPGAWRRAVQGVRAAVAAGLEVELQVTVTRPTAAHLSELADVATKLGVAAMVLRRVTLRGPAAGADVAVSPRFGLIQRDLEAAVQRGVRQGLTMMLEGFPRCAAPATGPAMIPSDAVVWVLPGEGRWPFQRAHYEPVSGERGCVGCPRDARCSGAPTDYVRRFGRTEIDSESVRLVNPGRLPPTALEGGEVYPPARGGRFPATRPSYVRLAVRLPSLGGDPLVAEQEVGRPERLRVAFLAPGRIADPVLGDHPQPPEPETTRAARVRLVRAAQEGARTLRIASAGSLAHPDAAELLREATRLQFPRIEVAGEAGALDACSDMQLRRLRGITRVDAALFGPDAATHDAVVGIEGAFDAALRALDRLGSLVPSIEIGCYAVLTAPTQAEAFAELWDLGDLPGRPWFRLAPRGGSLHTLASVAATWSAGAAREAIAAVLPKGLLAGSEAVAPAPEATTAWGDVPEHLAKPSGSDRLGCYTGRLTLGPEPAPGDDPGIAIGWSLDA